MNRWEGLDEFVAVAETGQFTAAAERMGVSSSHISRQVARLEERLQTRLLYRSTRRVSLSEAGQTFLQHCQRLQDARDEALRAVSDLSAEPKGLLRMTCAVAYGERFIVPLVNAFMADYPQLRVDIELSNRQLDLLHEGFDLAIRPPPERFAIGRHTVGTTRHVPLRHPGIPAPPRHSAVAGGTRPVQLPDRQQRPVELPRGRPGNPAPGPGQLALQQRPGGARRRPARLRPVPAARLLCDRASAQRPPGLLLEGHQPPNTAVWALYPQQRHLSPKVRQLVDYLKEGLAQSHPGLAGEKNLR